MLEQRCDKKVAQQAWYQVRPDAKICIIKKFGFKVNILIHFGLNTSLRVDEYFYIFFRSMACYREAKIFE